MKPEIKLPAQQEPKSVLDMTPYELSQIDNFQNRNRGWIEDEDDFNDGMGHDSDYFWVD